MDDLIKALQIFRKYTETTHPTNCEHDILHVCVEFDTVSKEDQEELNNLGFFEDDYGMFQSYKYGSC